MTLEECKKLESKNGKKAACVAVLEFIYDEKVVNLWKQTFNSYRSEPINDVDVDEEDLENLLIDLDDVFDYLNKETNIRVLGELIDEGNENAREWVEDSEECRIGIETFAFNGCDWAVEELSVDFHDNDEFINFMLKCADNGSKVAQDYLKCGSDEISDKEKEEIREECSGFINLELYILLKSKTKIARKILIDNMGFFNSFDWLENKKYIQSDDFAGAVVENIHWVFRSDDDLAWLERCVKRKIPQAQYVMSVLYQGACPDVMPKNEFLSKCYLKAAAKGGCELAIKALDEKGISADEKMPQKRSLTTKAKKGDVQAMFELGNVFAFEGNRRKAEMWWSKAARKGYMDAVPFRQKSMARKKKKALSIRKTILKKIPILLIIAGFGASWYFFGFWKTVFAIAFAILFLGQFAAYMTEVLRKDPDLKSEMAVYAKAILIPVAIVGILWLIAWWTGHI